MGRYLDLVRDMERAEPLGSETGDISDKRAVRSLLSLMSQPENRPTGDDLDSQSKPKRLTEAVPADLQWWRDEFAERAAHREYGGDYPRAEAEALAWGDLQNRWNLAFGERVSPEICAGCRRPLGAAETLVLMDGNRVHLADGYECLIRHGERWRGAATRWLIAMGLELPAEPVLRGE